MKIVALCIVALGSGGFGNLIAQAPDVVGTWKLVTASSTSATGVRKENSFGTSPKGLLIHTREGRMTAIISYSGRKPLSGADRIASPPEEQAAAFATFFAYGGRYSVTGNKITHHVDVASVENWVNTDLVRVVKIEGDRLTLITPPLSVGGKMQTAELVWERIR